MVQLAITKSTPSTATRGPSAAIDRPAVGAALKRLFGDEARLLEMRPIAADRADGELKHAGYGEPVLLTYALGGQRHRLVLRTMGSNWFGHDRRSDRAALALLAADTYDAFPEHVRVTDVGAIGQAGDLVSLNGSGEFYLLTSYADGDLYSDDLHAIGRRGSAALLDAARAHALCAYLVRLHSEKISPSPAPLYERAIRDLIGSGEGIFGISDGYPAGGPVARRRLDAIEQRCVAWRSRLRGRAHRLRRTHGDFHPYNILFRERLDFTVLDASRGGVGDPADDVAAMAINYFFGGIVHPQAWAHGFAPLWNAFWATYLLQTGDWELFDVVAPFLAWRALVLASPIWYPSIHEDARDAILSFAEASLDDSTFDPALAARFVLGLQADP